MHCIEQRPENKLCAAFISTPGLRRQLAIRLPQPDCKLWNNNLRAPCRRATTKNMCMSQPGSDSSTEATFSTASDRHHDKPSIKVAADATKWTTVLLVSAAVLYKRDAIIASYALGSLLNTLVAKALKSVIAQPRPPGATKHDHGMPSSHATALAFLSVGAVLVNITAPQPAVVPLFQHHAVLASFFSILVALTATWWRVASGYHTLAQVAVGWLVGSLNAILWCGLLTPRLATVLLFLQAS